MFLQASLVSERQVSPNYIRSLTLCSLAIVTPHSLTMFSRIFVSLAIFALAVIALPTREVSQCNTKNVLLQQRYMYTDGPGVAEEYPLIGLALSHTPFPKYFAINPLSGFLVSYRSGLSNKRNLR